MSGSTTNSKSTEQGVTPTVSLLELAKVFGRLGVVGFGGPAAHIAMMEEEVVKRRNWISRENFLDMLGVTNLIPGPNSTEMAIHVGLVKRGWRGSVVAGICFIAPAIALTIGFAYLYVKYGSLPDLAPLIVGIRPAIIAIILGAVSRLGMPMVKKSRSLALVGVMVAVLSCLRVNDVLLLFGGGLLTLAWSLRKRLMKGLVVPALFLIPSSAMLIQPDVTKNAVTLSGLGIFFLKIGSVLYGSGYVLVAFLQGGLVDVNHWLTQSQLLDAIAVGQFTPGPVLSTAAFVGYILLGFPGAAVSAFGIFLPSFVFVPIVSPLIARFRTLPSLRAFLDGVNASALGLMLGVCALLGSTTLTTPLVWLLFVGAMISVTIWNFQAAWIVAGSAIISWLASIVKM